MIELIIDIIIGIITFIAQATIQAFIFLTLLVRSVFDLEYRRKLSTQWEQSPHQRILIVSGLVFHLGCLVFALWFWSPVFSAD